MKKKNRFILFSVGGLLSFLAIGSLINHNLVKEYQQGDYIAEKNAYFDHKADNPIGHIKADKYVTPSDNKYNSQKSRSLGSSLIGNIESVWDSYTGKGTKIAIIDDGFDVDHPEFKRSDNSSAILPTSRHYYIDDKGTDSYNDDEVVYAQYSSSPHCLDEDWEEADNNKYEWATHGTNTSTTAAAPMGNGGGVGIAPEADILALKIDFSFDAISSAIYYAISQGVDVINMSLGAYADYNFTDGFGEVHNNNAQYGTAGYAEIAEYLENACVAAYNAGIIVVAAAGNEATWHKSYPACNSHVVGVGALGDKTNKGNANKLAEFTNYVSSSQTGEINVDILAPGYVYTAHQDYANSSDKYSSTAPSTHGHSYDDTQGTSFSSPIVAGAACLWKEKHPTGTPDQFLSDLQASADGIGTYYNEMVPVSGWGSSYSDVGPSKINNGRLNVARLLGVDAYVNVEETNLYLLTGDTKQITITSSNGEISYSTNNANVATVSNDGLITAKGAGNATITVTATTTNGSSSANISVNVQDIVAATSLTFDPNEITIEVGKTYNAEQLITLTPSNASRLFLFESENEDIATVDTDTGVVTGVSEGDATINALAGYGDGYDSLTVHVEPASTPTSWEKITSTSDLEDGDYLIVYEAGNCAFDGSLDDPDTTPNTFDVEIDDGKITYDATTAASKFTINAITGGYSIKSASGYYIGRDSGSNGMDVSSSEQYINSISFLEGNAVILGAGGKKLIFNTDKTQLKFRYLSNGGAIQLYKGASGSTPTPQPTKTLSSITLNTTNVQKTFEVGDTFNYNGLVVTAHYSDESSKTVAPTSVSTPNMSVAGNKTVTVTYTEGNVSKTATYQITVNESSSGGDSHTYTIGWGDATGTTGTYSNFTAISGNVTDLLTFSCAQNASTNAPAYNSNSNELRLYYSSSGNGGSITIVPAKDVTFTGFVLTTSTSPSVQYLVDDGAYTNVSIANNKYTVTNISATSSLTIRNANTSNTQLRIKTIELTYEVPDTSDKIIDELVANYTGGSIFVGGQLDTSKLSVTAKYTNSSKYQDEILPSSDYELFGFDSSSAGNIEVIVTYIGVLETSVSPSDLSTSFNVQIVNDNVKTVTVTSAKTYHPGETISKADLTVTITYDSGKQETTTDFTFNNDGYMFTYADAPSGGSNGNKQLSITYNAQIYNFNVTVNRVAHESTSSASDTLTRSTTGRTDTTYGNWSGKKGASGSIYAGNSAGGNSAIQLRSSGSDSGIIMTSSAGNVTKVSVSWNSNTADGRTLNIYGKNTAYSSASDLYDSSKQGTLLGTIVYGSTTEFSIEGSYEYIGVRSNSGALYLDDITFSFSGEENAVNVANYIMYEDTNNQCLSKLDNAITYFEAMSEEERTTFMTSNDYAIKQARTRLEAWLVNQNKSITYVDGDYVIGNNKQSISVITNNGGETIMTVVISSLLVMSFVGSLYLFSKRKH